MLVGAFRFLAAYVAWLYYIHRSARRSLDLSSRRELHFHSHTPLPRAPGTAALGRRPSLLAKHVGRHCLVGPPGARGRGAEEQGYRAWRAGGRLVVEEGQRRRLLLRRLLLLRRREG